MAKNDITNLTKIDITNTNLSKSKFKLGYQHHVTLGALFQNRFDSLGGERFFGGLEKKEDRVWYFQKGCLCLNKGKVYEIHGEIYIKWKKLGGPSWGKPSGDEQWCADSIGRFSPFNDNSRFIFWSPQSGANGVEGDICKKWVELGYERSYLGYPTSDEKDCPDWGRVSAFQSGGIWWWPETGAIDANEVVVHYTGLQCFQETGEISGSDEPYAIIGIIDPITKNSTTFTTPTYGSVDSGSVRPAADLIYRGVPNGIAIIVKLMEADEGDKNKYKKEITDAVQKAHEFGTQALGAIPIVGTAIAAIVGPLIQAFIPAIGGGIQHIFNFGDDQIGYEVIILTAKDMLLATQRGNSTLGKGIGFKFRTSTMRGANAQYQVFFGLVKG